MLFRSVSTGWNFCLEGIKIDDIQFDTGRTDESSELGLTTDERRLSSFESEASSFSGSGLLTFRTATCGGTASGTIATGETATGVGGTLIWLECVQHKKQCRRTVRCRDDTSAGGKTTEEIAKGKGVLDTSSPKAQTTRTDIF